MNNTHLPAQFFYELVPNLTKYNFFYHTTTKNIESICLFGGDKLYNRKQWNKLFPKYKLTNEMIATAEESGKIKTSVDK